MSDRTIRKGQENSNWRGGKSISTRGYMLVLDRSHPRASPSGYVLQHIVIAEKALGKPLPAGAVVHHVDENKGRANPFALVICPDDSYHKMLHRRSRAFDACGNANWNKCTTCQQYDAPDRIRLSGHNYWHPECRRMEYLKRKQMLLSAQSEDTRHEEEMTI